MPPAGRPFVKGQSGNSAGRPRVAEEFRRACREAAAEGGEPGQLLIDAWVDEIKSGGKEWVRASELLAQYAYGKPKQGLELDLTESAKDALEGVPSDQLLAFIVNAAKPPEKPAPESDETTH